MLGIAVLLFNMPVLDKRKGDDILSLLPASKRTRQEVVFSSREKAILESGINVSISSTFLFALKTDIS